MSDDRELRKGSAEVLILALLEQRDRHGYEIAKLIDERSDGALKFHVASLYPTLYRLERRGLIQGRWVEKAGTGDALLPPHRRGPEDARRAAPQLERVLLGAESGRADPTCVGPNPQDRDP